MIFRLSQKLNAKIKAGTLAALPLDENPLADWSAHVFVVGRSQYILLSNTKSLYSTLLYGKGVTSVGKFTERALSHIRALTGNDEQESVYQRFIAPASGSVRFARALDRSVTGSMNDMIRLATWRLAEGNVPLHQIDVRLNDNLLSALRRASRPLTACHGRRSRHWWTAQDRERGAAWHG